MIDLNKLAEPFPPEKVEYRIGATSPDKKRGMALAYIDARDVMDRLDEVCGPENWQRRYSHAHNKTICEIGIRIDDWVWKADGAGDTDVEAEKGAISTAFKRAAVNWGIGRYLYDMGSPWVDIEPKGKTHVFTKQALQWLQSPKSGARSSTGGVSVSKTEGEGSSPSAPSKDETPFFERESYAISSNAKFEAWTDDHWDKWHGQFQAAIDKCPKDISAFTKLQEDNTNHLNAYQGVNEEACASLMQNFAKRSAEAAQGPAS